MSVPSRNGLTKPKRVRGSGVKMVNMGELFANQRIQNLEMDRVPLVEKERIALLEPNDLLFARQSLVFEGAGQCSIFLGDDEDVCFESHLIRVRIDPVKADPRYIFYWLLSPAGKNAISSKVEQGAGAAGIRGSDLQKVKIELPDLEAQKKIADILGTIDEKIELNRQMNETLEQMGQALFRHYFIDNPEAEKWDTSSVGEYYDVVLGGTPSRSRSEYWQNGTVGWINSGKINEFRITEPSEYITEDALRRSAAKLLPAGTTVIAITGATLGQISRLEKEFAANQSVIGMVPKKELGNEYIYHWISYSIAKLIGHQTGGAQQHINRNNVVTFELPIPSQDTLTKFRNIIEPITNQISTNCFEIQTLTTLRDTLLPRLISENMKQGTRVSALDSTRLRTIDHRF